MKNVKMYEFDNTQPDGVDLPDKAPDTYRNQYILENFLHNNGCKIALDWGNSNMKFLVLIESGRDIVGFSAVIKYKKKVHVCVVFVIERLRSNGLGTSMLTQIASMYPREKITLSVSFEHPNLLKFYMHRDHATLTSIDTPNRMFVLTLNNVKLFGDIPLLL